MLKMMQKIPWADFVYQFTHIKTIESFSKQF